LKKFSKDTGEGADRLEDALRIAALRRTKKLDISKNVPIFSWLNKTHCGDCIAVMEKMPVHSVGLIVTSPPYNLHAGKGMKFCSSKWQKLVQQGYQSSDDAMPHEKYVKWQRSCLASMMRVLRDDGAIFYNHKWRVQNGLLQDRSEIVQGFPVRQVIIWHRNGWVNFNPGYFLPRFEIIYLICKPAFKLVPGANAIGDVWNIARDDDAQHPHPFPVELAERCIQSTSAKVVLDPFIGSGSTAVAAENLKRHWIGIDVSREYCEMADRRIRRRGRQSPVEGVQEIRGGALPSREVRSPAEMTAQARRV
jgi:modification methylase